MSTSNSARGRRVGSPDTREEILRAARELFGDSGLKATSVRSIASRAGVDPALVHHYFGTKDELFMAALEFPLDPRDLIAQVAAEGLDGAGDRLLRTFLSVWDEPQLQMRLIAVIRSALEPGGERFLQDGLFEVLFRPVLSTLVPDRVEERVTLVASQMVGLVVVRYLLAIEPLASLSADGVVAAIGPNLQRYLADPLD